MNEFNVEIVKIIGMFVLLAFTTFLIYKETISKLKKVGIDITIENKKEIKWLISSILGILTAYFYLLRLLLSL